MENIDLYDKTRHEPLVPQSWDPEKLEAYSHDIMGRTIEAFNPKTLWPIHPLDSEDSPKDGIGYKDFYFGAGGIFWLLNRYSPQSKRDFKKEFLTFLGSETFPENSNVSLFFDHVAFLLFKERISPSQSNREQLYQLLLHTSDNHCNEVLYGHPSTLIVTYRAFELTQSHLFVNICLTLKELIWKSWEFDQNYDCYLWTQDLGTPTKYIGAAHGAFGNLQALYLIKELLTPEEVEILNERATQVFKKFAISSEDYTNWPVKVGAEPKFLLHWCHGAPGALCALADHLPLDPKTEELFLKAGELIWKAGPLKKGTSLCHGTSGNALALLKVHKRTGDKQWLERAQAFAMYCMEQCQEMDKSYGQLRYSLWTGDLGLVWLNEQLKDETANVPFLDIYQL